MENQIKKLEEKVIALVDVSGRLRKKNASLQANEIRLLTERAELLKKNDTARSKVEAIILRLKALEQDSE